MGRRTCLVSTTPRFSEQDRGTAEGVEDVVVVARSRCISSLQIELTKESVSVHRNGSLNLPHVACIGNVI